MNNMSPIGLPETPSTMRTLRCVTCKEEFETVYVQAKYCHNPCIPAKSQKTKNQKIASVADRAKLDSMNNKWLSRRL